MTSTSGKMNNASYSVMCTIMSLFEKDLTMPELINELEKRYPGVEFNNFVASKYINTCRSCSLDIQKVNGKYCFVNYPFGEKFTKIETTLARLLEEYSEDLNLSKINEDVRSFVEKLHLSKYKATAGMKSSKNRRIFRLYEKARSAKCNIKIFYFDGRVEDCFPKEVYVSDKGKIFFKTSTKQGLQEVNPDEILDIKITDQTNYEIEPYEEVVFEVKGKLAKRYQLRENEQTLRVKKNGNLVITNKYEDKTHLLRRLMRYDSSCRLMKPTKYVEEFKQMIDNALENNS